MTEPSTLRNAKHTPPTNDEDEILKYLLTDSDFSSPEGSPLLVLDNESPISSDSSPWRVDEALPTVPSGLPDISIDLDTNPESLLYGSSFNSMDYTPFSTASLSPAAVVPTPKAEPYTATPPTPPNCTATATSTPLVPLKKVSRTKKRPRVSEPPPVPSPEKTEVALPRDTLLQISSQGMERYVENLASTRALSMDDQKELKRQKRLIKNRESAQLSRERKRAYIDQLEEKITQLVNENALLRNDNAALRQALSRYQPGILLPKVEPTSSDFAHRKTDPVATKMAGLLTTATTIGAGRPSSTAKAGVCLLIVLFTFGLFINSTSTVSPRTLIPSKGPDVSEIVPYHHDRSIGYKRAILEVLDEGEDYLSNKKQLISTDDKIIVPVVEHKEQVQRQIIQHPIHVKPAGIYKVSYSPEPAQFLPPETVVGARDHSSSNKDDNSTYMLFLDPRPDLDNENDAEITAPPVSKSSDLQVSTHAHIKHVLDRNGLPPMIISLVVPSHIANGSNPLFPKEGYSADSLMEVTCQVMDVSITTSERPQNPR